MKRHRDAMFEERKLRGQVRQAAQHAIKAETLREAEMKRKYDRRSRLRNVCYFPGRDNEQIN